MNPNANQALEDEELGIQEEVDDIDYDALYGGLDIDVSDSPKSPEIETDYKKLFGENVKDYAKQFTKGALIGVGGTYGDLAELAGLNPGQSEGAKARNSAEFETLQRMEQPGYKPSFSDINLVSSSDDVAPGGLGLPTSQTLEGLSDSLGGPADPQTPGGRLGKRTGTLVGAGLAFGQVNPIPALAGGLAGQGVEEAGGGPLLQAGAEIATMLLTQGKSGRLQSSAKKEVQDKINDLRRLGYTEEEITLAINSASKGKKGGVTASKGAKTEQAFEDFTQHSDQMVSDILSAEIPGIEHGTQHVHQLASDAYGQVAREASNLVIKDSTPFINSATGVVRELNRNLGTNPEAVPFLNRLREAVVASTQSPTAENFMNFYKELNSMGKWLGRSQRDRLISQVKDGIKDTFRAEGKQGRELANKFEEVNAGIRKAYQAEDVHDLIQKTVSQDGMDYKKFYKLFDKPDNVHLFEDVLGATQTRNLNTIAKTGKEIKDFDKAWKSVNSLDKSSKTLGAYYLFKGDWVGLAKLGAASLGGKTIQRIAEKSLTDPKFQNLYIKGLHAIVKGSPKGFTSAKEAMKKYLEEEGIDVELE